MAGHVLHPNRLLVGQDLPADDLRPLPCRLADAPHRFLQILGGIESTTHLDEADRKFTGGGSHAFIV